MELSNFFELNPMPKSAMQGTYIGYLVVLSYIIASLTSYVALDITERIRTQHESMRFKYFWLLGGAFTMGMGIWTMHFIGMLAFVMPMEMEYSPFLTAISMIIAIVASGLAFYLIRNDKIKLSSLIFGGILMGIGICAMHYTGMAAMLHVKIRYIPSLFFLSVFIGITASIVALLLMIKNSDVGNRYYGLLKLGSALIMGLSICGLHYTGMAAAVFEDMPEHMGTSNSIASLDPVTIAFALAMTMIGIITIAMMASKLWINSLQSRNQKLLETEAILEQKSKELQRLNIELSTLAIKSIAREKKMSDILTAAGDGIIVIDHQGKIELCNQAVCKMLALPEEKILHHNISSFILQKKPFGEFQTFSFLDAHSETLWEYVGKLESGMVFPIELSISQSLIENRKLYIIVFRNISERKRGEENLNALQQKLIISARYAGMAEVATSILHNVGNVFNSIGISSQILLNRNKTSHFEALLKLSELLKSNRDHLDEFLDKDPIGKILPEYLQQFVDYWKEEDAFTSKELNFLNDQIQYIKKIIDSQQSLAKHSKMNEMVQINSLLNDAITINGIEKKGIMVERIYEEIPPFEIDKVKLLQILVNLTKNAMEALLDSSISLKQIILKTGWINENEIYIEVNDNGVGIREEDLLKIFNYGFTTKKKGHGFGLHPSVLSAKEFGGELRGESPGLGKGATFTLVIPLRLLQETSKGEMNG